IVGGDHGNGTAIRGPTRSEDRLGTWEARDLATFQIKQLDKHGFRMEIVVTAEGQGGAVGGPGGIGLNSLRRSDGLRRAPIGGDDEDFPGFSRLGCAEGDGLAIGGPMRSSSAQRRIGELETLRAVKLAAPKRIVGITDISDPFAIAAKIEAPRGNPREIRNALPRLEIVADQLGAGLRPDDEELLTVLAWNGS